jgi:peptidoglycan L-alanyl-D-glutamate endopeptidase CwlK
MPAFSKSSTDRLSTCHPDLQRLFNEVVKRYDCTIIEGHRTDERQAQLFTEGKTKIRKGGKHTFIPSLAVDVMPYPVDWKDDKTQRERRIHFAGIVKGVAHTMGIRIRWGGDWNQNDHIESGDDWDMPHFELLEG